MLSVQDVIQIAKNEIGYYEKASNYMLDVKDANKGSGNWTKYSRDLVNKIGGPYSNGCAWCDIFVDWVICEACKWDIDRAKQALNGFSAYCPTSAQYYKNAKRWGNIPQLGAQFFTGSKGHEEHTGIVIEIIDNSTFRTVEGNYQNKVTSAIRKKSQCSGFGMPDYDNTVVNPVYEVQINTNIVKYGVSGTFVKAVQRIAYSKGIKGADGKPIKADGECGKNTVYAIKEMQKIVGISPDGICGNETWGAIINDLN